MKKSLHLVFIASLSFFVIAGCTSPNGITTGNTVALVYTATFTDGQVFEKNTSDTPLIFTVGSGQVIEGLDEGVMGLTVGDTKTITINPNKGYGRLYDENKLQKVSQLIFDKLNVKVEKGTIQKLGDVEGIIMGSEQDGSGNDLVLFDTNPKQTRDTLQYKVTILSKK